MAGTVAALNVFLAIYACNNLLITTEACDGYKLKINKISSCEGITNVFKLQHPKLALSSTCLMSGEGCVDITKGFKTCKVQYDVRKKATIIPFKGEVDLCEEMEKNSKDPRYVDKMKRYKFQEKCPIDSQKVCVPDDETYDITKHKARLPFAAGSYTGNVTFNCDCGTSCYYFDLELKRGK